MLMDTSRERRNGLGEKYTFEPLRVGHCAVHQTMADTLLAEVNDVIYIKTNFYYDFKALADIYNANIAIPRNETPINQELLKRWDLSLEMPCRIQHLMNSSMGKAGSSGAEQQIYMEYQPFLEHLSRYVPSSELSYFPDFFAFLQDRENLWLYQMADFLLFNLPQPRAEFYKHSDYTAIQTKVTSKANQLMDALGFFKFEMKLEILQVMEYASWAMVLLALVFDLVLILFVTLSIMLLYSLLTDSVESKTFEYGVFRMAGMGKYSLLRLISIQSVIFVIPSIVVAFICSVPILAGLLSLIFSGEEELGYTPYPTVFAALQAVSIGIGIPLVSSLAPAMAAVSKDLNQSLDRVRGKRLASQIEIINPKKNDIGGQVAFGAVTFIYGLAVYYVMPWAMVSMKFNLLLKIFLFIMIGLIFGLNLVALNLQYPIEVVFSSIFLIFERAAMRMLVLKNLQGHREKNLMTSLTYSISMALIIFLVVSYSLVIKSISSQELVLKGGYIYLSSNYANVINPRTFDPVLKANADIIESFSYITPTI